ncbi:MAG: HEAT repeat domain-containing protein, partial [Planctomycetes bacterium]|nr:HEAT repeat domain-containing protein [Planctomycetota bacterium]
MTKPALRDLLERGLRPHEKRIHARLVDRILEAVARDAVSFEAGDAGGAQIELRAAWSAVGRIRGLIESARNEIAEIRKKESEFGASSSRVKTDFERRQVILKYAAELGARGRELKRDEKALARWLDEDAIRDRFARRLNRKDRELSFLLERLGALAVLAFAGERDALTGDELWNRAALEDLLMPLFSHEGDRRVVCAAFRCLSTASKALAARYRERVIGENTLQFIYRSAIQEKQDIWIQCEALSLLEFLSPDSFTKVIRKRLASPGDGDDLFFRRRAVRLLGGGGRHAALLEELLDVLRRDPSSFVRQEVSRALATAATERCIRALRAVALEDSDAKVRAAALCESLRLMGSSRPGDIDELFGIIEDSLGAEQDSFVLKTSITVARDALEHLSARGLPSLDGWRTRILDRLDALHAGCASTPIRRCAARARERIWLAGDPAAQVVAAAIEEIEADHTSGAGLSISKDTLCEQSDDCVGRVLSVRAQESFGYTLRRGWI